MGILPGVGNRRSLDYVWRVRQTSLRMCSQSEWGVALRAKYRDSSLKMTGLEGWGWDRGRREGSLREPSLPDAKVVRWRTNPLSA